MEILRQQLAEQFAGQESKPSPAQLRLLRRIACQELLGWRSSPLGTDAAHGFFILQDALTEGLMMRRGFLTLEVNQHPALCGLGWYPFCALILNALWVHLYFSPQGILGRFGATADQLTFTLESKPEQPPRWPQEFPSPVPGDFTLTFQLIQILARQAGGHILYAIGRDSLASRVALPLKAKTPPGKFPSSEALLDDRFSPFHLFLAGYTILPD